GQGGASGEAHHLVRVDQRQLDRTRLPELDRLLDRLLLGGRLGGEQGVHGPQRVAGDLDAERLVQHRHGDQHGDDELAVPQGPLHAQVVPVAGAELLLVADLLYGVLLDLVGLHVGALGAGDGGGVLTDGGDDPVADGGLGEAAGVQRAALQHAQPVVDGLDDVPAAEGVDLPVGVGGDQFLGELPAAPAGAHAEYPLGAGVEDGVGLLFGAEPGQGLAQLFGGGLPGAAGHRLRHLGADAAAGQEAVPALPQVVGGAFADPLGPEPAGDGGDDAGACVPAPEPVEGHPEQEQHREGAHRDEQRGGQGAGALVLALGHGGADLEDEQPDEEARQEEHAAQHHDGAEPVVALPADAVGG